MKEKNKREEDRRREKKKKKDGKKGKPSRIPRRGNFVSRAFWSLSG